MFTYGCTPPQKIIFHLESKPKNPGSRRERRPCPPSSSPPCSRCRHIAFEIDNQEYPNYRKVHCVYVCIYIYIYIHTHIYTYIYIYIYMHIHTCRGRPEAGQEPTPLRLSRISLSLYIYIYIYIIERERCREREIERDRDTYICIYNTVRARLCGGLLEYAGLHRGM